MAFSVCLGACYSRADVSKDVNEAWRGRSSQALQASWGKASVKEQTGTGHKLVWTITHTHVDLPEFDASLTVGPEGLDAYAETRLGQTHHSMTQVFVLTDPRGLILEMQGPSIRWGAPSGANLRHGLVLGLRGGMGRLDDTSSPLPGMGMYIGGMLSKTLALVGNYSFASGSDDAGSAIGMAWSLGAKHWVSSRFSLRGGPALILAFDPGFENLGLEGGVDVAASYAVVRSGSFALDLRVDVTAGVDTQFATLGIGVNLN